MSRRILRWVGVVLATLALILAGASLWLWFKLRASLPHLDGQDRVAGLQAEVVVERDALGVPTIRASSRADAARATGFVHAQDRFFQMDLLRRAGAGELAELLGPALLSTDRELRRHRLRGVARQALAQQSAEHVAWLQAYTAGVNAGLAALQAPPPEYLLLRSAPQPWLPEDTFLVLYAMFFSLQDSQGNEDRVVGTLRQVLPAAAFDFFVPKGTDWDAAVDGSVLAPAPIPGPEVFSFDRSRTNTAARSDAHPGAYRDDVLPGSNSWAVDGRVSGTGAALVANDMHLGLGVPVIWYRLRILCPLAGPGSAPLDITGATLPGAPVVVVGSNGAIAWSFTNGALDNTDLVALELAPNDPTRYRTPEGWRVIEEVEETLRVRGGVDVRERFATTVWGPIVKPFKSGAPFALHWLAHRPEAANVRLFELEGITNVRAALELAPHCGIPVMNFVVGDRDGRIGWTLCGRLPRRVGFTGESPVSWADGARCWDGFLPPEAYPRVLSPAGGRLWTANNRIAGSPEYLATGPSSVDLGARARQIRDGLQPLEPAHPADMLRLQLDDRALFLDRWQKLLLATLEAGASSHRADLGRMRTLVQDWGGRAVPDSVGYTLVREFRRQTIERVLEPLTVQCRELDPEFGYGFLRIEQPVWTILEQKPRHLVNPRFASCEALLRDAANAVALAHLRTPKAVIQARWGSQNRVRIQHPLSRAVPFLSRWLDLPPLELPGDSHMPRAQGRGFGASERLAVSPGHEAEGYFHMPGGQSGHPLSPWYHAGYEAWAQGSVLPFLPGTAQHRLRLSPVGDADL